MRQELASGSGALWAAGGWGVRLRRAGALRARSAEPSLCGRVRGAEPGPEMNYTSSASPVPIGCDTEDWNPQASVYFSLLSCLSPFHHTCSSHFLFPPSLSQLLMASTGIQMLLRDEVSRDEEEGRCLVQIAVLYRNLIDAFAVIGKVGLFFIIEVKYVLDQCLQ